MKTLLTLLSVCFVSILFGQKIPVGLIIEFDSAISNIEKSALLSSCNSLKPNAGQQHLKGFDVSLLLGEDGMTLAQYTNLANEIEVKEEVVFTSVLYKTIDGSIGGDLSKLYIQPINELNLEDLHFLNATNISIHHYLKDVWEVEISKNSLEPRLAQRILMETGKFKFVSVNTLHTLEVNASDPYVPHQWSLENSGTPIQFDGTIGADMEVTDAWDLTTGNESIKIAVLDSGTDTNHIDLVGNLLPGFDATGGDSKGYPNTTFSNDSHGTCTAGIISALGDNDEGIAGVAYSCKVIPIKIFFYADLGTGPIPLTSTEAGTNGIIWAVNDGQADILSNSWGLRQTEIDLLGIDTAVSNMVIRDNYVSGRGGKGVPMLFSSGNEYDDFSIWPASVDVTISVGASSMCDELKAPTDCSPESWWGSNYGENLDVTAPGVKVLTTDMTAELGYNNFIDDDYSMFNGTSAACPNAAGVMALILSVDPELSAFDARGVLSITAEKVGGYDYDEAKDYGEWSTEMGYGRVNAYEAVYYATHFSSLIERDEAHARIFYSNNETYLSLTSSEDSRILIYDMSGRRIESFGTTTSGEVNVLLNNYVGENGTYLIEIQTQNKASHTLKAVIFQ